MSTPDIEIEIERLDLQGIDSRHRDRIERAVRRELEALIARGGVPPHWAEGGKGAGGIPPIEVEPGQAPARVGERVARAIYQGGK